VQVYCATQEASIVYTLDTGEGVHWKLYTEPLRLPPGKTVRLRARAIRIGYQENAESQAVFTTRD
jgi:hypothetical protein